LHELVDVVDAYHAVLPEHAVDDRVVGRQRGRVGGGGGPPRLGPPYLEDHEPTAGRPRGTGGAQERRRIAEVLAHNGHDARAPRHELPGQLLGGDDLLVARRQDGLEGEAVVLRPFVDGPERAPPTLRQQHGRQGGLGRPRPQPREGRRPDAGGDARVAVAVRAHDEHA
jgi:hypothetical protein